MNWMAWVASKHTLLVHLPVAAALMIPIPVLAAQRGGRGIRPWWVTCRYLAWCGLIGSLLAVVSGLFQGLLQQPGSLGATLGAALGLTGPAANDLFRLHTAGGFASLVLGALCLRSLFRQREDHQGIGFPALLLGLAWCACALTTAYSGALGMGHGQTPGRFLTPPAFLQGR